MMVPVKQYLAASDLSSVLLPNQRGQKLQVGNAAKGLERRHKTGKEKAGYAAFPTAGF